eukprot:gene30771-35810_t
MHRSAAHELCGPKGRALAPHAHVSSMTVSRRTVPCASGRIGQLSGPDMDYLKEAAKLADSLSGLTQPHPNAGCVLVDPSGKVISSAVQRAQGTVSSEVLAISHAKDAGRGATAYLNLEPGDCHGDSAAHLRGSAIKELRSQGMQVDVLGESFAACEEELENEAREACLLVNEPLLHRAALRRPLSILKYAMTLDGKIACQTGHSAWVSSSHARARVFDQRARVSRMSLH